MIGLSTSLQAVTCLEAFISGQSCSLGWGSIALIDDSLLLSTPHVGISRASESVIDKLESPALPGGQRRPCRPERPPDVGHVDERHGGGRRSDGGRARRLLGRCSLPLPLCYPLIQDTVHCQKLGLGQHCAEVRACHQWRKVLIGVVINVIFQPVTFSHTHICSFRI